MRDPHNGRSRCLEYALEKREVRRVYVAPKDGTVRTDHRKRDHRGRARHCFHGYKTSQCDLRVLLSRSRCQHLSVVRFSNWQHRGDQRERRNHICNVAGLSWDFFGSYLHLVVHSIDDVCSNINLFSIRPTPRKNTHSCLLIDGEPYTIANCRLLAI